MYIYIHDVYVCMYILTYVCVCIHTLTYGI